ncbi:MAG: cytochrome C [Planctomyces sp.]|nr:cytochrome C [Planctomyces sp.]
MGGMLFVGASPWTLDVGYQPKQPVPFSHALHAGKLKMDCRYCHNTVEVAAFAAVPATATCIKCHRGADENGIVATTAVRSKSPKLLPVRESYASGESVQWVKIHDLPDYAYFNHSAHVRRGVGCVSCHGRIDKMEEVNQRKPLSMAWCLECHRDPTPHLRPLDKITQMDWVSTETPQLVLGKRIQEQLHLKTKENCSTCHR